MRYKIGDFVEHKEYGTGIVVHISKSEGEDVYNVFFISTGVLFTHKSELTLSHNPNDPYIRDGYKILTALTAEEAKPCIGKKVLFSDYLNMPFRRWVTYHLKSVDKHAVKGFRAPSTGWLYCAIPLEQKPKTLKVNTKSHGEIEVEITPELMDQVKELDCG